MKTPFLHNLFWIVIVSSGFLASAILSICADPIAVNTSSINTQLPTLSPQTQALLNQTQNLSNSAQALLKSQLSDLVRGVVTAADNGKGEIVRNAITQQYAEAGEQAIKAYAPGTNFDQAVVKDFNYYRILGLDRVIIDKAIAFVEVRIAYHPDRLAKIIQEEKDTAADPDTSDGDLWSGMGGTSSADKCEKLGAGRATYYLVVQKGLWKIHSTYFSLNPMTPSELDTVSKNMQTLVQ